MTNEQILKKAIEKAEENGWKLGMMNGQSLKGYKLLSACNGYSHWKRPESTRPCHGQISCFIPNEVIIFSHSFAKAFWGEEEGWYDTNNKWSAVDYESESSYIKWQYHLQQLVLCEKPLDYLEKYL